MSILSNSKIVLKGLFSKPATVRYPFEKKAVYPNTRGSIDIGIESCIFCGLCSKKCPTGAIEVVRNEKMWAIDRFRCIACNACVDACPKKCLYMANDYTAPASEKSVDRFYMPEEKPEEQPAEQSEA